uniref:Uncharacterized protein n=1 Tax=Ananas comosus var. bracteatus TaxID=296719 RepID=A0A6V7PRX4_ANACO|nr:unnamed protein product [Ananas comosus var. bracteatus]
MCHAPRPLPIWSGSGTSIRRRTDSTSPVRPRLNQHNHVQEFAQDKFKHIHDQEAMLYAPQVQYKLSPRLTLNLIGEENLHSHTETVCGTTTSAPIMKYSGDHYLSGATTSNVNRLTGQISGAGTGPSRGGSVPESSLSRIALSQPLCAHGVRSPTRDRSSRVRSLPRVTDPREQIFWQTAVYPPLRV